MEKNNNTIKIITHNGFFHADELFAIAALEIYFKKQKKKIEIIRTRDAEVIKTGDILVDVGRKYDPSKNFFDHHQESMTLKRENGLPYAAFGLIWLQYGVSIAGSEKAAKTIERKLATPIDALDNGIRVSKPTYDDTDEYRVSNAIPGISMAYGEKKLDTGFKKSLSFCLLILKGEIKSAKRKVLAEKTIRREVLKQSEPNTLILNKYLPFNSALSDFKKVKLVIFPDINSSSWCLQTVKESEDDFKSDRILFPVSWRGKENQELFEATSISGSLFCHKSGFFATAKTREDAINMAKKALKDQ